LRGETAGVRKFSREYIHFRMGVSPQGSAISRGMKNRVRGGFLSKKGGLGEKDAWKIISRERWYIWGLGSPLFD